MTTLDTEIQAGGAAAGDGLDRRDRCTPPFATGDRPGRRAAPRTCRDHRGDRLCRRGAGPAAVATPECRPRRPHRPRPRPGPDLRDPPAPGHDRPDDRRRAAAGRCRLPGAAARGGRRPRPEPARGRHGDHRPGPRLPPPRSGRLPALVRLRPPATRPPRRRGLRPPGAPSRRADRARRRARGDRRCAGLLSDGDAPRARPARARGPHRRPRGRCQERRLGRRPRGEVRADVRRGQREREGVRHRRASPRCRDRAGARRDRPRCEGMDASGNVPRPIRGSWRSTSSPTSSR